MKINEISTQILNDIKKNELRNGVDIAGGEYEKSIHHAIKYSLRWIKRKNITTKLIKSENQ